jgi:hypothetical protein
MVSGKPYISVHSATMKAENGPRERQSRLTGVRVKLAAKMKKTSELIITRLQRP